jgi:two-component system LytT family sensor kinase
MAQTIKFTKMKRSSVILLHAGYWLLYLLLVAFIIFAVTLNRVDNYWLPVPSQVVTFQNTCFFIFFFFVNAIFGFYVFYFVLFPRYLMKKRIVALIVFGFLAAFLSDLVPATAMAILVPGPNLNVLSFLVGTIVMSIVPFIHGIIGLVMRGFISWYADIKVKEELYKKNHEMELALIKAQVNPHFLFNTLNNIDMLIQKDANKASDYLNKLSDILRFMLYEIKTEKIPLAKELSYLEKYLELHKIRTSNPTYIQYHVKGVTADVFIEPMLFMPFIENAMKHAENKKIEDAIKISFVINAYEIRFECENAYPVLSKPGPEPGGLGNDLIRKRLALLYPGRHTLELSDKNGMFKVNLVLSILNEP